MNMMIDSFVHEVLPQFNNETNQGRHTSPVLVPLMYLERFSDLTGISLSVLKEKVDQGDIPTTCIEGRRMADISSLHKYFV